MVAFEHSTCGKRPEWLPTGNEILSFTLDSTAGDTLDLRYTRVSGNMNLGLVVLSAENEVFFQASLVTSTSLTFTLPTAGTIHHRRLTKEPARAITVSRWRRKTTADGVR
ncbi:MAG: hypothetical protein R2867_35195 [Caldilineaceae bacterium]